MGVYAQVIFLAVVPGDMRIHKAFCGNAVEILYGVKAVVAAVDEYVVNVQMQAAVGFFEHGIEKLEFAEITRRCGVGGHVFHTLSDRRKSSSSGAGPPIDSDRPWQTNG